MENEKKRFSDGKYFSVILLCIGFFITVICIATGSYMQTMESIQIGSVATQRYVALKDEVDVIATQKKKAEAAATVGPLYQHDSNIEQQSISEIEGFFKRLDEMQGTLRAGESLSDAIKNTSLKLPVVLSVRQYSAYQALNQQDKLGFQKSCICSRPAQRVRAGYRQGCPPGSAHKFSSAQGCFQPRQPASRTGTEPARRALKTPRTSQRRKVYGRA